MEPITVLEPIPLVEPIPQVDSIPAVEPIPVVDPIPVIPILAHLVVIPSQIPTPAKNGIKTPLPSTRECLCRVVLLSMYSRLGQVLSFHSTLR